MTARSQLDPIHIVGTPGIGSRAVFLDRDGVINRDNGYVGSWGRFFFEPGAIDAIATLNALGYRIIVVTNQSGIARGYYTQDAFQKLTMQMLKELMIRGAKVDAVYACPHLPNVVPDDCDCRKPKPGMILQAMEDYGISPRDSILVGDKRSDILAAKEAGIGRTVFVLPEIDCLKGLYSGADEIVASLYNFVETKVSEKTSSDVKKSTLDIVNNV